MRRQSPAHGSIVGNYRLSARKLCVHMQSRQKPACRAFDIALDARYLSREKGLRVAFKRKVRVKAVGRIYVRVAVHYSVSQKLGVRKRGYHRKHPLLFAEFQVGLEPDEVVSSALFVFLSQL